MEPQPEHELIARLPQTSQSGSAFGGGSADAADERAGAPAAAAEGGVADDELVLVEGSADAADEEAGADADADAAGEGGVGEGVDTNAGDGDEVDGPVAALDDFPPFFFGMGWCGGVVRVNQQELRLAQPLSEVRQEPSSPECQCREGGGEDPENRQQKKAPSVTDFD